MLLEGKQIHRSMKQKWEPRNKLHIYGQLIYTENQRTYKRKNVCVVAQLCPTLWDPMDCRGFSRQEYWSGLPCPPPGNLPDPGIGPRSPTLQADSLPSKPSGSLLLLSRFSHVRLLATPWTAAHQAPLSLGFSRQEHWSGLPLPSPMHESEKWKWSRSVLSDSERPHGLQPTRLLHPWDFPGRSTGVWCHCHRSP